MKMGKRFCLGDEVYLVRGAKRGAIYDLNTGEVYSINEQVVQVLNLALEGKTPAEISSVIAVLETEDVFELLETLVTMKLGIWYEGPVRPVKSYYELPHPTLKLRFAWLELTNGCNLRCIHCYAGSAPEKIGTEKMTVSDWKAVIRQLVDLDCRSIQFIGGEPLLYRGLCDLIQCAKEQGIGSIEVFTNATLVTEKLADFFAQLGVRVAFSLYAPNTAHDLVTKVPGSFSKTISNIKLLRSKGVPVRAAVIAMSVNQEQVETAVKFAKEELGVEISRFDIIRPTGRGCFDNLVPNKLIRYAYQTIPRFSRLDKQTFINCLYAHSCWNGELCITPSGNVLPCIFERHMVLGNVLQAPLREIVSSEAVARAWGLSKDLVEVCRDCEYRYACFDCRPKTSNRTGNLFSKPLECLYDPYKGKWAQLPCEAEVPTQAEDKFSEEALATNSRGKEV